MYYCLAEKENDADLKNEIKVEETEPEEIVIPTVKESIGHEIQIENNSKKDSDDKLETNKDREDTKKSSDILSETQTEVTNNTSNDITRNSNSTEDTDQGLSSTNMLQPPCSMVEKISNSGQSDDEPVAKKRRISASAFLELTEPNTNIDTNVIHQNLADDMNAYIAYTSTENVSSPFLSVVSNF